uniref:Uncharacterized protein n=1 Tax=Aegilops tauschii subsp. strangulata TaxID=200361 RepID=A0A453BY19_AEGTS
MHTLPCTLVESIYIAGRVLVSKVALYLSIHYIAKGKVHFFQYDHRRVYFWSLNPTT